MKRCPECDFIYLDSDTVCDLDGSTLVAFEEDAVVQAQGRDMASPGQGWRWLSIVAIASIAFGVIVFLVYQRVTRKDQRSNSGESVNQTINQPPAVVSPSPVESPAPTPQATVADAKASPSVRTKPAPKLSNNPVSTGGAAQSQHGVIIWLSDGGNIAADEAWRTNEGVWYRRNGMVTLLKRKQVKGIEKAP